LRQLFHGIGRGGEQGSVGNPLIAAHEFTELFLKGEGHHEVITG
jgi:hypothetical protein